MEDYTKLSYSEIREGLAEMATVYPQVMLLEDSLSKLNVTNLMEC